MPVLILSIMIILMSGCEPGKEKSVTGDYFNRSPGELKSITVDPDSICIGTTYRAIVGTAANMLAGSYENITAFSVFKFFKLSQSVLDSLDAATLKVTVNDVWKTGDYEFGVYRTTSDWSDTTRLDPDIFLPGLDSPISVVSDTSSEVSTLTFDINKDEFSTWGDYGSFLIKDTEDTETGTAMFCISSDNSSSSPFIEIVTHNSGAFDTTIVKSVEGTYYISDAGFDSEKPVLSDGDASGFVLNINLPDFAPSPTAINKCILTLKREENLIPTGSLPVFVYLLTEEFTTFEDINKDFGNPKNFIITPDASSYAIDITDFIDKWHNLGNPNYGLLFEPSPISSSPNYAVVVPSDSLAITYTSLPEVD